MATPESVLIVKLSSMGDVIHTLPAACHLRAAFPNAKLGWAVEEAHAELLSGQSWLDEVIVWRRNRLRSAGDFVRRLRRTRWDLAVDFQGILRSAAVMRLAGARRRVGYRPSKELAHWFYNQPVPRAPQDCHAVEWYLRLAQAVSGSDAEPESPLFPLHPSLADQHAVEAWLARHGFDPAAERLVILCPDCRREANRWPIEKFAALAKRLLAIDGICVALSAGPAARELCDRVADQVDGICRADGCFGVLGSAELFRRSAVVVTGDTGPMHLAVAVGTRVAALLGPTNPNWTGPYSPDAVVLTRRLECSPCKTAGRCPLGHDPPRCMDELTVEQAYAAVMRSLECGDSSPLSFSNGSATHRPWMLRADEASARMD